MKRLCALAAAAALSFGAADAHADQERTVQWNDAWPRVRWWEVANIAALTVGSVLLHVGPSQPESKWSGPILFDRPARDAFRSTSRIGQRRAANVSDYMYQGMVLAPYAIDNFVVSLGVHQNADVALQLTLINMQSLGISGVVTLGVEHAVGRSRPYVARCKGPDQTDEVGYNDCGGADDFKSFYSGHAAAMFTMAGLTCVHHQHLPLYGGGLPDGLACAFMVGLATTGSMLRVTADRHWMSDVILGASVGIVNGYFLPLLMHYGVGWNRAAVPTTVQTAWGRIVPVPQVYAGGGGINISIF